MLGKLFRALKPDREDWEYVRRQGPGSIGQIVRHVLPHGLKKPNLDEVGRRKLAKSAGLMSVAVLLVNLLTGALWWPAAWTDPQSISTVTAGIAWVLNLLRKLVVRYVPQLEV